MQSHAIHQNNYPVLQFSTTPTFFVALCKIEPKTIIPSQHSYIMAGCEDPQSSVGYVFSAVGKVKSKHQKNESLLGPWIGSQNAVFNDEILLYSAINNDDKEFQVQYQAYEISYKQYENYIRLVKAISPTESFSYYFCSAPNQFTCSDDVSSDDPELPENNDALPLISSETRKKFTELSALNTCRHAAVEILHQLGIVDDKISSLWLSTLSHHMTVKNARIITPLFIAPPQPDVMLKTSEPVFYALLNDLYQDILRISLTNYELDTAIQKTRAMIELYKQLSAGQHHQEAVTNTIETWKKQKNLATNDDNAALVNKPRKASSFSFFGAITPGSALAIEKAAHDCVLLQSSTATIKEDATVSFTECDDDFESVTFTPSKARVG